MCRRKIEKRIREIFPELGSKEISVVTDIYAFHIHLLRLRGVKAIDNHIAKSIMDTLTYSIRNTLNLAKV